MTGSLFDLFHIEFEDTDVLGLPVIPVVKLGDQDPETLEPSHVCDDLIQGVELSDGESEDILVFFQKVAVLDHLVELIAEIFNRVVDLFEHIASPEGFEYLHVLADVVDLGNYVVLVKFHGLLYCLAVLF